MAVIGFSFIKFNCERKGVAKGSIEIKHNIGIKNVEKTSLNVGGNKNEVLRIEFNFDVLYGSEIGHLGIVGDVIYTDTKEIIDETFKGWEADKKLNSMIYEQIYRFVYSKSIIKSLEMSDALNLPAPIPLKLSFGEKKN